MLSLDISGCFDHISQDRVLHVLRQVGYPEWVVGMMDGFMKGRHTQLTYSGWKSAPFATTTGVPQGSPLSPILFLIFSRELLLQFDNSHILATAFSDDTNLIACSQSAAANCRSLERAHEACEQWARKHGVKFSPEKYQLIHFTRKRSNGDDLRSTVHINGFDGKPCDGLRVLGVWVDSKLRWTPHAKRAAAKGLACYDAMNRVVASTWGPSLQRSRLLYTAVVRPTMMYGVTVWGKGEKTHDIRQSTLKPLVTVQNKCLRKITGAYKRTPVPLLEKEAGIEPLRLYARGNLLVRAQLEDKAKPYQYVEQRRRWIWNHQRGRQPVSDPPRSRMALAAEEADRLSKEWEEYETHLAERAHDQRRLEGLRVRRLHTGTREQRRRYKRKGDRNVRNMVEMEWKLAWRKAARNKTAVAWKQPWETTPGELHDGLSKVQSTVATLLRTEFIGLNDWLSWARVPGISPECPCGWARQTPQHVVTMCSLFSGREKMWKEAGTSNYERALSSAQGLAAVTRWFIHQKVLHAFSVARELDKEDETVLQPFTTA